jgi:hypothetical protein
MTVVPGGMAGKGGVGPPAVGLPTEEAVPFTWNPHPTKKVVTTAMMAIRAICCRLLLDVDALITRGHTRLDPVFIPPSHRKPESLLMRLSTATWDTLGCGNEL